MFIRDLRRFLTLFLERFHAVRAPVVAGSLAFTTLLSLVPLVVVGLTVMGRLPVFVSLGQSLRSFLLDNLLPDRAGRVIATYALQFSGKAGDLTLVGSVALISTAVLLLLTIDRVFNAIWIVKRPRALWIRLGIYWLAITLGPLVLAASVAATSFLVSASLGVVNEPEWLRRSVYRALPLVLFALFFAFLYRSIPNRRIHWLHAALGGVAAALGMVALQRLLGVYFAKFPSYTLLYGTFSAVPIFLVWLYASWVVVLAGAVIAAVIPDFLIERRLLPATVAGRFYAALRLSEALAAAQRAGSVPSLDALARISRQRIEETESMLEQMRSAGWVAETEDGDWLLVGSAGAIDAGQIFMRFVLPIDDLLRLAQDEDGYGRAALLESVERIKSAFPLPAQIG